MRRESWEQSKSQCQHYKRHSPEKGALYQLVHDRRHDFECRWDDLFQPEYGYLRPEVIKAYDAYLNCGILEHGVARVYCDSCQHTLLVAFSCKKRGVCPSCGAKRAVKFAEHLYHEVLEDCEQRHVVFSLPKRLRPYIKYDRSLASHVFQAAWRSLAECLGVDGYQTGVILTLQTAGDALNFNPHLHGLLSNVLFAADGSRISLPEISTSTITERFCELVLSKFCKLELISDDVMSQILSQEHSGFSVWVGEPFQDAESKHFVSRYIERGPVSLERLRLGDEGVIYETKDGEQRQYDPLEFLALLSSHIPKKYESLTRYYGHYSSRVRGERKKREVAQTNNNSGQPISSEAPGKASSSWAACVKKIYEVDPLECPRCKGQMRIIAFVQEPNAIKAMMKSLGLSESRAPPPLNFKSRSVFDEQLCMDEVPACGELDQTDYDS